MGTVAAVPQARLSVRALLGGGSVLPIEPDSSVEWVAVIRRGISSAAVDSLATSIHVTRSELAAALGISGRTLARRKREGILNSEESAKVVRLARVVERAEEVFEDLDATVDWLKTPNAALGAVTPLSLLDTDVGAEGVLDTLGRIKHGVFG
jgi:putative toxin-antitoxin system antitoxin component (TIGR02293 family)